MKAVLISIQPKWCHKIIDGKKTIEVRKALREKLRVQLADFDAKIFEEDK